MRMYSRKVGLMSVITHKNGWLVLWKNKLKWINKLLPVLKSIYSNIFFIAEAYF
jgi:hypothetical protein